MERNFAMNIGTIGNRKEYFPLKMNEGRMKVNESSLSTSELWVLLNAAPVSRY